MPKFCFFQRNIWESVDPFQNFSPVRLVSSMLGDGPDKPEKAQEMQQFSKTPL